MSGEKMWEGGRGRSPLSPAAFPGKLGAAEARGPAHVEAVEKVARAKQFTAVPDDIAPIHLASGRG